MVKVYFGPFKHSPAPEMPLDERRLWLTEFDRLKGLDVDVWTNNPLMLDAFEPSHVYLWLGETAGWVTLPEAVARLLPEHETIPRLRGAPPGCLALLCERVCRLQEHVQAASNDASTTD